MYYRNQGNISSCLSLFNCLYVQSCEIVWLLYMPLLILTGEYLHQNISNEILPILLILNLSTGLDKIE